MSDSTELSMADENAIARAMQTPMFNEWSILANNSELIYRGLHLKKGEDDAIAEKKLIAQICLAAEVAGSRLCRKNKAERIKNEIKRNQVSPR